MDSMNNALTLNDQLVLSWPDGFHVMDEAALKNLMLAEEGPCAAISDPDRHIVVSVGWKPMGGLTGMLLGAKDIARSMEGKLGRSMRDYGWRAVGARARSVGGEAAEGFGYEYEAQGVEMLGECLAVKHGKTLYCLHFYARRALKDESLAVWEAILAAAEWR